MIIMLRLVFHNYNSTFLGTYHVNNGDNAMIENTIGIQTPTGDVTEKFMQFYIPPC